MKVTLIDYMGDDLTVINAARVSFAKHKEAIDAGDERLIKYLAAHGHWSPFAHPQIQLHFKAPIFVARQLVKHQVGMVWNEISRRYVDYEPEFWWPDTDQWRGKPENAKQGSTGKVELDLQEHVSMAGKTQDLVQSYRYLIHEKGVCPEQARMILPQNIYTEWYWTGSLMAWARVYNQRVHPGAQQETSDLISGGVGPILSRLFPISWKELTNGPDM